MLLISIGVLLCTGNMQAQDTTALHSASLSDTAQITIAPYAFFPFLLNSRISSGNLVLPPVDFRLPSDHNMPFGPTSGLSTYHQYGIMENKMLGAQRAVQSIQINLQSNGQQNKIATAIGLLVNSVCLGGVVYQMVHPPKLAPHQQPKGAPPQPKGVPVPSRHDSAPRGNPKPVK